jgi:hypothetical protein
MRRVRALWCWSLSFRKRDWEIGDYPVFVKTQEPDPAFMTSRFKHHRYVAQIANWWLSGAGDSKEDAIRDLTGVFANVKVERARTGRPLPRPGTQVPIEFVPQERVYANPELAEDFIHRVLGLPWAWISDESSLWDFHVHETNDAYHDKIKEVYGVDVSDIESGKLWAIFDRIATARKTL